MSDADFQLIERVGKGDKNAFATLVQTHTQRFYAAAYRVVLNKEDAEDVVQEAFLKLWDGRAKWKAGKGAKFTTWFYRVVYNQALDHIAKKRANRQQELPEYLQSDDPAADDILWNVEQGDAMAEALAELPERQRTAMVLFYTEELSQKEVADIMGITPKAVESLTGRAKVTLKERMRDYA